MYFPDLIPYTYGLTESRPDVLCVGWLSIDHPFERGAPDARLVSALERIAASPVNLYRGYHCCEFCPEMKTIHRSGTRLIEPKLAPKGNGEVRVMAANGITYVAPVLVLHYVAVHEYLPPKEFIEAVLRTGRHEI